jgi:hypothetical protein
MDQGRIVEKGSYDELSLRGGRFTSLLKASGLLSDADLAEIENQQSNVVHLRPVAS